MSLRTVNYGGGVQSTALLVLAGEGRIDFKTFLFANVGDDSEAPETIAYVNDHAKPYAAAHGIDLIELHKTRGDSVDTVYGKLTDPDRAGIPIPYRSRPGGPPMSRSCTVEFKMRVCAKWRREHGATEADPAVVALGYSQDEAHRANDKKAMPGEVLFYPLIDFPLGSTGLRLTRADCAAVIVKAGLPVPPKSACWFCPHHSLATWRDMRRTQPERFEAAADLETDLRKRSMDRDNGPVFISSAGIPLRDAIADNTLAMFEAEGVDLGCDSGMCWT